jgi:putative transposase
MAKTEHYYTRLEPGKIYHVYNRIAGDGNLFMRKDNYEFFLRKFDQYLSEVVQIFAYSLLPNHFHLMIRVQPDLTTFQRLSSLEAHEIVSAQFKKFFQSYALAFNKDQNRSGTLFQTPFKRCLVDNPNYYCRLVYYIHANAQMHGIIDDFREYEWSSYGRILIPTPSKLFKEELLAWFGGREEYIHFHNQKHFGKWDEEIFIDEF